MSAELDRIPLPKLPGRRGVDLSWPIGLAGVVVVSMFLPISGSPAALAGFLGLSGILILFARRWLIAALPVLAVLGPHFLPLQAMGVNVFGFRLLIMLLALFVTPLTARGDWWFNPVARRSAIFMAFWVFWGLLSLLWTPDYGGGLRDIITIVFGIGLLLTLFSLGAHKTGHLEKLRFGWLLGLMAATVSAFLEIVAGRNLQSDLSSLDGGGASMYFEPETFIGAVHGLFDNSNMFGGYLLLTVPFVFWSIERAKGPVKLVYLGLLAVIGVLVLYSASRLSLIGLMFLLAFYGLVVHRRWYMPLVVAIAGLGLFASYGSLLVESDLIVAQKLQRIERAGGDRSISHRTALTLNGLWMAYKSGGLGIGAAGFEEGLSGDVPVQLTIRYRTDWNAHNFLVEVLSEYGVLTFAALVALLGWIGLIAWRAQRGPPRRQKAESARVGRAILMGLVSYVFFGVTGGSIIPQPIHWMFLASLVVMAAALVEAGPRDVRPLSVSPRAFARKP